MDIKELAAKINKKTPGSIILGSEIAEGLTKIQRASTGILSYDMALGGGWPLNHWNEIVGAESSGKTAVCLQTVAANQAADPDYVALWVAAEAFVPEYAAGFGVDMERLWIVDSNEMEPTLALVLAAVQERAVDCVVIDSMPVLITSAEMDKDVADDLVAPGARMINRFFRKCAEAQRRSMTEQERPTLLLMINQWRDAIGVMFGDPRTTSGGKAKNYYYFTRVEVSRTDWISEGSKTEDRVGQVIKMRTMKNKTFRPSQTAQVDFYFADASNGFHCGDVDTIKDIVNVCIAAGVITRKGAWYYYGDYKWNGKDPIADDVRADLTLQAELRHSAMAEALGGKYLTSEVDDEDTE